MRITNILAVSAIILFAASCNSKAPSATTAWTPSGEPTVDSVSIQGDHGALSAIVTVPGGLSEGQKIPVVVVCHGFTGNKNGAVEIAVSDSLVARGIATIRFDFNGHGASEGKFTDMTVPNEIVDAKKVIEYAKALPYAGKIGMAGHSQGGVVTSMVSGELGSSVISAEALLAPAAVLRDDALRGNTMGAMYDPYAPGDSVAMLGGAFYLGGKYIETAITLPIYETAVKYGGKAIIVHGDHDRVVPYTYGERYSEQLPDATFHLVPGADHSFTGHLDEASHLVAEFMAEQLF
jgi:alpha/beta superfamily hydrolase